MPETLTTVADMLEAHNEIWDMEALGSQHPEIVEWFKERVTVSRGLMGDIVFTDVQTDQPQAMETQDMRVAVRDYLKANA